MIIAIDGPSASGKGYIAKRLALHYNLDFYATGEIVRLYAFLHEDNNYKAQNFDKDKIIDSFKSGTIVYHWDKEMIQSKIFINQIDITEKLYTSEISNFASIYMKEFPYQILEVIREIGKIILHNQNGFVVEGRQVTSILFPDAKHRFYLDADIVERAKRRKIDFDKRHEETTLEKQIEELSIRDNRDKNREVGPLRHIDGVKLIDCSKLGKDESLNCFIENIDRANKK